MLHLFSACNPGTQVPSDYSFLSLIFLYAWEGWGSQSLSSAHSGSLRVKGSTQDFLTGKQSWAWTSFWPHLCPKGWVPSTLTTLIFSCHFTSCSSQPSALPSVNMSFSVLTFLLTPSPSQAPYSFVTCSQLTEEQVNFLTPPQPIWGYKESCCSSTTKEEATPLHGRSLKNPGFWPPTPRTHTQETQAPGSCISSPWALLSQESCSLPSRSWPHLGSRHLAFQPQRGRSKCRKETFTLSTGYYCISYF